MDNSTIETLLSTLGGDEDGYDEYYDEYASVKVAGKTRRKTASGVNRNNAKRKDEVFGKWVVKLNTGIKTHIKFKKHDIHYKDQYWGIESRDVEYNFEQVVRPGMAKNIALAVGMSKDIAEYAASGKDRWFRLVTFEESIPLEFRELGYVRLSVVDRSGKKKIEVNVFQKNGIYSAIEYNYNSFYKLLKKLTELALEK